MREKEGEKGEKVGEREENEGKIGIKPKGCRQTFYLFTIRGKKNMGKVFFSLDRVIELPFSLFLYFPLVAELSLVFSVGMGNFE